jgi:hypothetical protein
MNHKRTTNFSSRPRLLDQTLLSLGNHSIDGGNGIEIDETKSPIGIEGNTQDFVSRGCGDGFKEGTDFGFFGRVGYVADEEGGFGGACVGSGGGGWSRFFGGGTILRCLFVIDIGCG